MTRSRRSTSRRGASRRTEVLRDILRRAEARGADLWSHAEVQKWSRGLLGLLVDWGIIQAAEPADGFEYNGCERGCWIDGTVQKDARSGRSVIVHHCHEDGCGGRLEFPPETLHQWRFDLHGTGVAIAKALGAVGGVFDDVPDRVVALGVAAVEGERREVFVARGLGWDDSGAVYASAARLRNATSPVLLVAAQVPLDAVPGTTVPNIVVLTDCVEVGASGLGLKVVLVTASRAGVRARDLVAKREPTTLTRPVSMKTAAREWFGMDPRTLVGAIAQGVFGAKRINDRLWVFDQSEVDQHRASRVHDAKN